MFKSLSVFKSFCADSYAAKRRPHLLFFAALGLVVLTAGCGGKDKSPSANLSAKAAKTAQAGGAQIAASPGAAALKAAAPEVRGQLLGSDKSVSSTSELKGKFLIVNFWATWCGPCIAELPALERMYQQLKTKYPGGKFELVAVNADIDSNIESVKEMVHSRGLTFPVLLDPEGAVVRDFNLTGFPETFFIDPEGNQITVRDPDTGKDSDRLISDRPWDTEPYIALVSSLISGGI